MSLSTLTSRMVLGVLAMGLLVYTAGCDSATPEEATGTVSGVVTMPDGETPVTGATVTLASAQMIALRPGEAPMVQANVPSTTTDSQGRFTLEGVPAGEQTLIARRGIFSATFNVNVTPGGTIQAPPVLIVPEAPLASIPGSFDSMHDIADEIGLVMDEDIFLVQASVFDDLAEAQQYAMVFLNCATTLGTNAQRLQNARTFMENGGVLYASDLSGATVDLLIDGFSSGTGGTPSQTIEATVVHDDLATWLEGRVENPNQVDIVYNLGGWRRITDTPPNAIELLSGVRSGQEEAEPLAAMVPVGDGLLVFTTFHNTANLPDEQRELLRYFIFVHTGLVGPED